MSTDGASGSKFRYIAPAPTSLDPGLDDVPEKRKLAQASRGSVRNACTNVSTFGPVDLTPSYTRATYLPVTELPPPEPLSRASTATLNYL